MTAPRHEFYETDEKLTLSIFDKGVDAAQVSVLFEPRKFTYTNGDKSLVLEPLKGQIDPDASDFSVGKVKVEVRLVKRVEGRWGGLTGDSPDPLSTTPFPPPSTSSLPPSIPSSSTSDPTTTTTTEGTRKQRKNWDGITTEILSADKEKTTDQDPNVGGDSTLNSFFQKIFADADEDTKKAMMKSYQESGGTTLSTNWDEVQRGKVDVKPPTGSEWKRWG